MGDRQVRISTFLLAAWLVALGLGFAQTYRRWVAAHPTTMAYQVGSRLAALRDATQRRRAHFQKDLTLLLVPLVLGACLAGVRRSVRLGRALQPRSRRNGYPNAN